MHDPDTLAALERSISIERLSKYLNGQPGDFVPALQRYEFNTALAEAFYTPLQAFEITLRNRLHNAMAAHFGSNWLCTGAAPLDEASLTAITEANDELRSRGKDATPGRIVAELRLSFWVGLCATKYDASIWRSALHRAFVKGSKRQTVHGRLNAIRRFRNRIAHHEPIFHVDGEARYREIIEATGWLCPETAAWADDKSRVFEVLKTRP